MHFGSMKRTELPGKALWTSRSPPHSEAEGGLGDSLENDLRKVTRI